MKMGSDKSSKRFVSDYFVEFGKAWNNPIVESLIIDLVAKIRYSKSLGGRLIFAGNGASASISSHCALDYTKQGKMNSICFSSDAFITALANDYGYDRWLTEAIKCYANKEDLVILISSSGRSPNIVSAAEYCKCSDIDVVTLTGFENDNPLKTLGDLNFWVNSKSYNIIECTHMFWLMSACDLLIGKSEYSVS